jgi:hypothetical protein
MADIYLDKTDKTKSIFEYNIDDKIVNVSYWYSWRIKLTDEEFNDYLKLEALKEVGNYEEANALASQKANGNLIVEENIIVSDTRNWYQNWIDNNIIGE